MVVAAITRTRDRPGPRETERLTEAELISAAMFMYADKHDGTLPPSLDALKPDYLGQSVDTSFLTFGYPVVSWNSHVIIELLPSRSSTTPITCSYAFTATEACRCSGKEIEDMANRPDPSLEFNSERLRERAPKQFAEQARSPFR